MKLFRTGAIASLIVVAVVATACGSDSSSSSSGGSAASASSSLPPITCASGTIRFDGSSAQKNAISQWIADFKKICPDTQIDYQGAGSGAGLTGFTSKQLDIAGSDAPFTAADITKANANCGTGGTAINIPMVPGPIAVAFNVSGVDKLTLTPTVIAQIFTGKITTWDNAAIKASNSSATLPSTPISVITRSDSSGTSFNFSSYLSQVDPTNFTAAPNKQWPVAVGTGAKGSAGVAGAVKSAAGSIGYVELSAAEDASVKMAAVDSGSGAVEVSGEAASKFLDAGATVVGTAPDLTLKLNYTQKGAGMYPIVLVAYEIACTKYADANVGTMVKSFLTYTSSSVAQGGLNELGYAPLPASLLPQVQASVAVIS